jgi:hypothetical protein
MLQSFLQFYLGLLFPPLEELIRSLQAALGTHCAKMLRYSILRQGVMFGSVQNAPEDVWMCSERRAFALRRLGTVMSTRSHTYYVVFVAGRTIWTAGVQVMGQSGLAYLDKSLTVLPWCISDAGRWTNVALFRKQ